MIKDRAIITMAIGKDFSDLLEITSPSMKRYAERVEAEFVVINEKKISYKFCQYEKFQLYDLFTKFRRIVYIDADAIVRDDCPDLFNVVPQHKIGIFNEGRFMDFVEVYRDACVKYGISLPKWDRQSYNTGVMVLSQLHRDIFKKPEQEFDVYGGSVGVYHYEQPYLNLKIISEKYEVHELDYKFNRMSILDKLTGENRLSSYIVHYAGSHKDHRIHLVKEDLESWERNKPDYKYSKNIHIRIGGGLGDQIDAEPVVRYIKEKMYPKDNVLISTNFKDIFRHLPVKIANGEREKNNTIFYNMETLPSPESLLWQFLAQTLCHTTDFASISTLRRILPDNEKQIKLQVDKEDILSLINVVGIRSLNDLILVHPGKGWESKTFPKEYWQSIIDSLVKKGLPVCIIGRYVSEEQGLVDIQCPEGAIDLRNLLNLRELIALISQAKILLSNDSAPVHIAGAFDNWIILLPSCKHPDHVLPYRKGMQRYRTIALYKKLVCDSIDSSPTQIEGQTIDFVSGNINDFIADISNVVDVVNNIYEDNKNKAF